jgi:flagellar biosynthesis protein FlhG
MSRLLEAASRVDPETAAVLREALGRFRPRLVFNMGRHPDELELTRKIDRSLRQALSIEVDHFGFVFEDPAVRRGVREGAPFLPLRADSPAGRAVIRVAERIARFWDREIPESAERVRSGAAEDLAGGFGGS